MDDRVLVIDGEVVLEVVVRVAIHSIQSLLGLCVPALGSNMKPVPGQHTTDRRVMEARFIHGPERKRRVNVALIASGFQPLNALSCLQASTGFSAAVLTPCASSDRRASRKQ